MPELNNTFVRGRMNKDLDDRLVPPGEYRDALNIEVSTSESSDVGTVQNLKGNNALSSDLFSTVDQENVYHSNESEFFEANDVSVEPYSVAGSLNIGIAITSNNSYKIKHSVLTVQPYKIIRTQPLEIGKSYDITLDFELNIRSYREDSFSYTVGLIDLDTSFTDAVEISRGGIVNDGVASGSLSKSFYCESSFLGIYVSSNFSGFITNINVVESTSLQSDTGNAVTVGSKVDTATDTIYNFVHKASDFKLNTYT